MPLSRCSVTSGGERAPLKARKRPICKRKACRSSRPRGRRFRSSVSGLGSCAGVPARGWSSRLYGLATGTSIPRKCTITSGRLAKDCTRQVSSVTRSSSRRNLAGAFLLPRELERAARDCLVRLRLSEVDLLLLHWPNCTFPLAETLGALSKVKRDGLARHIGVLNFTSASSSRRRKLRHRTAGVRPGRMPSLS